MDSNFVQSTKERRQVFSISIRYQENSKLFKVKRTQSDESPMGALSMTVEEIERETSAFERALKKGRTQLDEAKIIEALVSLRQMFSVMRPGTKDSILEELIDRKVIDEIMALFKTAVKEREIEMVRELTWLFQVIFTCSHELLMRIVELGVLPLFDQILNFDDLDILENLIWAYANLVAFNETVRDVMDSIELVERIYLVVKQSMKDSKEFKLMRSFILFLGQFFCIKPFQSFDKIRKYFNIAVKFFSVIDDDQLNEIIIEIMEFLLLCTNLYDNEDFNEFMDNEISLQFVDRLIDLMMEKNQKIAKTSVEILRNVFFFEHPKQLELLNSPLLDYLKHNLEKKIDYSENLKLCLNIAATGKEFVQQIIEKDIAFAILLNAKNNHFLFEELTSELEALISIFSSEDSNLLLDYALKNFSLIGEILLKLKIDIPNSTCNKLGEFLRVLLDLGDFTHIFTDKRKNPIVEEIVKRPEILQALEYVQVNRFSEFDNQFKTLIDYIDFQ